TKRRQRDIEDEPTGGAQRSPQPLSRLRKRHNPHAAMLFLGALLLQASKLMSEHPHLFDRELLRQRQRRALALGPATFLIDRVAEDLSDRLSAVLRQFNRAVDIGTPTDAARRVLAARRIPELRVVADEEALPFANGSVDLVVSLL